MLPLDDPRWSDLYHRAGSGRERYRHDPDAPVVPDELRHLLAKPGDLQRFRSLWPYLCSEGSTYPSAYAAVPYLVEIARRLSPAERTEYVVVIGLIVMYSGPEAVEDDDLLDGIANPYREALPQALALLTETLSTPHDLNMTQHLLTAAAALKGYVGLAQAVDEIDDLR
jgi:hypothetical protein